MTHRNANARINVKILIIVALIAGALGISLVAARQVHRNMATDGALAMGQAAYDSEDWSGAVRHWRIYLNRRPDDVAVLTKYGESLLNIRPSTAVALSGAIYAYSQLMKLAPQEDVVCERLASLYIATRQFDSLAHVARTRLQHVPDDPNASLWQAQALAGLKQQAQARRTLETLITRLEAQPGTHRQYVHACLMRSELTDNGGMPVPQGEPTIEAGVESNAGTWSEDPNLPTTPLGWLDRGLSHDPHSVELLLAHARMCRQMAREAETEERRAEALMKRAYRDLEVADALKPQNPHLLYALGEEWIHHGDLPRAEAQLATIDGLSRESLTKHFLDPNDAKAMRLLYVARLAVERGEPRYAADLVAETLDSLREPRHRLEILPIAIDLNLAVGRVDDANDYLAQFARANGTREETSQSVMELALYRARVAMAKEAPYRVIDILQPIVRREASNPQSWLLWDVLAIAYRYTGQTSRAVDTWSRCLALLERHPRLTDTMARRAAEIRAQLPMHYARLGDWNQVLAGAGDAAPANSNHPRARLIQIGAIINLAAQQGERLSTAQCDAFDRELRPFREQDPNNVTIRVLQAILWEHRGQNAEAETELRRATEECGKPLAAEMRLVGLYRKTGRSAEAVAACREAIAREPGTAELWSTLAELHGSAGDRDAAQRCLEEGLEHVTDERARDLLFLRLAHWDLTRGDRAAGIARLTQLVENHPQDTQAHDLLLAQPETREDPNLSQRLIAELRQIEGESGLTWRFHQASLWLSSRDWHSWQQDIVGLLQYCIAADARMIPPVLLLGSLYERVGSLRQAEGVYRQALAVGLSAPEVAEKLANLLISQGRQAEAIEILPGVSPVRRPHAWERAGHPSHAIMEFRRRIESDIDRTDAESRVQLARLLYEQTKDAQGALSYLDEARAIDPNSHTQVATRALVLGEQGRVAEAVQTLDDYVANHDTFRARWMRAAYLAEHGEFERAEKDFRRLTTFADGGEAGYGLLADFYHDGGRLDQAIDAVEEGIRAYPKNLRIRRRQMQFLRQRGQSQDRAQARAIRIALQKELPDDTELMYDEAMEKLADPTPETLIEARKILERAITLSPLAVNAHLVLIDVLIRQGELRAASEQAVRAMEANPNSRPLRMARAKVELALGYGRTAFTLADQVLENDASSVEALAIAVNGALASRDRRLLEQVAMRIDAAAGRISDDHRLVARAQVYLALQQPQWAVPELEAYCKTEAGGSHVPALIALTNLYRATGDMDRADRTIARAEAVAPDRQAVVHTRFLLRVAQNRWADLKGISSAYISAGDQDPAMVVGAASRLASLETRELRQEALALYEYAAAKWPKSLDARFGLGLTLYTMGEAERAKQIYEQLLREFPNNPQVLNDLAWILQEHDRDFQRALELANQGVRLSLGNPELLDRLLHLLDTRATILMKTPDRLIEAKQDLDRLVQFSPNDSPRLARALLKLALVCVQLKDLPQAGLHLTRAMEIDRSAAVFTAEERSQISQVLQIQSVAAPTASHSTGGE